MHKEDIVRDFKDLPLDLDFNEPNKWPANWSFGCGGAPFQRDQWHFSHTYDDLHRDVYPLPKTINSIVNNMIKQSEECGRSEIQCKIKSALNL